MEPVELPEMRSDQEVRALKDALRATSAVGHDSKESRGASWRQAGGPPRAGAVLPGRGGAVRELEEGRAGGDAVPGGRGAGADGLRHLRAHRTERGEAAAGRGYKVGLIRPKTVSPFPYDTYAGLDFGRVKAILDVEMSIPAQMVRDVELAVMERCAIHTCLHAGGEIMGRDEVISAARRCWRRRRCGDGKGIREDRRASGPTWCPASARAVCTPPW